MTLNLEECIKVVILFQEGTAIFHTKDLQTGVCYKATPRGKLKKKKGLYRLKTGDIVLLRILVNRVCHQIMDKIGSLDSSDPAFNFTPEDHGCSFINDLDSSFM